MPLIDCQRRKSIAVSALSVTLVDEEDDVYTTAPRRVLASDMDHLSTSVILPSIALGATSVGSESTPSWSWLPVIDSDGGFKVS